MFATLAWSLETGPMDDLWMTRYIARASPLPLLTLRGSVEAGRSNQVPENG